MRRFSTLTLSLLTLILGVTAWAQVARNAEKAPRAAGDMTVVSVTPASGSVVTEIGGIVVTWSTEIGMVNEDSYNVGTITNEAGKVVANVNADPWPNGDYTKCVLNAKPIDEEVTKIDAPGTYTVVINEDSFGEDFGYGLNRSVTNARVELTYTIEGSGSGDKELTAPKIVNVTPDVAAPKLNKIEITYDQAIELSKTATMMPLGLMSEDGKSFLSYVQPSIKDGDDKTLVLSVINVVYDSGTYALTLPEGYVFPKGSVEDAYASASETLMFTVDDTLPGAGKQYAKFELVTNTGDEIDEEIGFQFNFDVEEGTTLSKNGTAFIEDENGKTYEVEVIDFVAMGGVIIIKNENITYSGLYTLTVREGFVTDAEGNPNAEFTKTWQYTNNSLIDDDRKLEIEYAKLVNNETGEELNLMDTNTEVPVIGTGWTLKVRPNIFDVAQEINMAVSHEGVDEYGVEGIVIDRRIEMYVGDGRKTSECFQVDLAGNTKLEKGIVYTITFDAEDTHVAPDSRKDWGTVETTVKGGTEAFVYSPAELINIYPEEGTEIYNPNQQFRLTFSQPVDVTIDYNEGMGGSTPLTDVTCNEDRTVWTFTLGASRIENETADLGVIVKAKDLDGKVVKGNSAADERSCFAISWACHLGCPAVTITPASGTVKSIYSFTAVAEDGMEIQLGSGLERPYITTASGAFVTGVDMNSERKYLKNGQMVDPNDENISDEGSVKITFNLEQEVTAPGKYYLVCPFAAFGLGTQFSGSSSRPMQIEYIIEGTPEYDRVSVADGAELSELSYVVVYINNDVDFGENTSAKMILRTEEAVIGNYELIQAQKDGVTMLIADFMNNGKPLQLEAGVDYTLTIAKNSIFLAGTDMAFPALNVNIKGAAANAATVALTEEIAGFATSVTNVAKGATVAVTFAPAQGWKVGSVEFNGADVTASVANNVYTTPALDADASLVATYEYDGKLFTPESATEIITDFKLRAYSQNSEIVLENLTKGMIVNVYTINGALAGNFVVENMDVLRVSVPEGIYVVTVTLDGKTQAIKLNNK